MSDKLTDEELAHMLAELRERAEKAGADVERLRKILDVQIKSVVEHVEALRELEGKLNIKPDQLDTVRITAPT